MALAAEPLRHPTGVNTPLFHSLIRRMENGGRWVILDLGRATPETVSLLGQFRCRLDIADLTEDLEALRPDEETNDELLRSRVEELLPPRGTDAPDIILCWDLLNYLERPAIRALSARLAARALPGTLVHALIAYRDPDMSATPGVIVPLDEGHLLWKSATPERSPAPRYTPEDLTRSMSNFVIERAVLLANGMQEFLFRH